MRVFLIVLSALSLASSSRAERAICDRQNCSSSSPFSTDASQICICMQQQNNQIYLKLVSNSHNLKQTHILKQMALLQTPQSITFINLLRGHVQCSNLHGFYLFSTQFKVVIELETQTDVIEGRPLTYFIGMGEKHIIGYK